MQSIKENPATKSLGAISIVIALLLGTPQIGWTGHLGKCHEIFQKQIQKLAGIRDEFVHNDHYTQSLPTTEVRNQCNYGGCWVYGTVARVEQLILAKSGKKIDLSEQFLIAMDLIHKSGDALKAPGQTIREGGFHTSADWLMHAYGVVPNGVWTPRTPFEKGPYSGRLITRLNNRIANYHLESAQLADGPSKIGLLEKAEADIDAILNEFIGPMPSSFNFEGVNYESPRQFGEKILPAEEGKIVRLKPPRPPLPENLQKLADKLDPVGKIPTMRTVPRDSSIKEVPIEQIEQKIKEELLKGKSVILSLEWMSAYIDKTTGIMSVNAFHAPEGHQVPSYEYRNAFGLSGGGHLVDIVGFDEDAQGNIIKFKVKNSWGADSGDHGYYHMYRDYFREFLSGALFHE